MPGHLKGVGGMKKPLNRFALALWIAAFLIMALEISIALELNNVASEIASAQGNLVGRSYGLATIWGSIRTAALGAGQLAAFGALIELVDRVRWEARSAT